MMVTLESTNIKPIPEFSDIPSRLRGRPLWLARLAWLLIFLLVIVVLSEIVPPNYTVTYGEWFVTQARPALDNDPAAYETFVRILTVMESTVALLCILVGLVVFRYKSDDRVGLFVSATLIMLSLLAISNNVDTWRFPHWLSLPSFISGLLPALVISSFLLFFHLFPDGRFEPRWTRWSAALGIGWTVLFTLGSYFLPRSWREQAAGDALWTLFGLAVLVSLFVALFSQARRYRSAGRARQQQVKWVIVGLVAWLSSLLWSLLSHTFLSRGWDALIGAPYEHVALALIPITVGMSILRYRLWDVDILINRTLVYGTLTAAVLGLYGLAVGTVGALTSSENDWLVSVLGLSVAAVAAAPLRRRLQDLADRWLPITAPHAVSEGAEEEKPGGSSGPLLSAARFAWLIAFGLLAGRLITRMAAVGTSGILSATRMEWAVQEALKALPVGSADGFVRYLATIRFGSMAIFWLVAILVFWRKRDEWMALYVSSILMLFPFGLVLGGGEDPLLEFLGLLSVGLLLHMLYLFPDGRFVPRSWRWRGALLTGLFIVPLVAYLLVRVALPLSTPGEWAYGSSIVTLFAAMAGGIVSQHYRYRRLASPAQRQQTKWVLFGMGLQLLWAAWGALWLGGVLPRLNISQPMTSLVQTQLNVFVFLALPLTIGVAMLRYRLWDVDVLINRALVFTVLTMLVAAVYILVVGSLGVLFQAAGSLVLSVLATGLIAILFNPLRMRLQAGVNRLMYGERDDPVTVLTRLGERLEETAVPSETLPSLAETIALTLKLPYVGIAIREGETFPILAAYQIPGARGEQEAEVFPLFYQSEPVGQLLVSQRSPNDPFTPADRRLLQNVARQAGAAVHAAQLTAKLQRSRQRLVTAREEERRRLRRDLHDGLGPQLATLSLKVDAARNQLGENPEASGRLLIELKSQVQNAIQDVRRLVYELRPPALDQLGLVSALRQHAASHNGYQNLHVTVDAPQQLPLLPAAVEVAAYRIALEAMTNVVRHAGAQTCTIRLWLEDGLRLEVADDGRGLPDPAGDGMGMISMRERAAELGGSFTLESLNEGGTVVRVYLPFTEAEPDYE